MRRSLLRADALLFARLCLVTLLAVLLAAAETSPAQGWRPSRNVELAAPSTAGGGSDHLARLLQKLMQEHKLTEVPITVLNKPASGGVVAWNALNQNPLDGHHLAISTANLLTNHITGRSALNYTGLTAVAQLFSEAVGIAVRADSPIRDGRDLAARLKADSHAVSAAVGTGLGNTGHITLALIAQAAGGEPRQLKAVVFPSASQGMSALLGGHVDVVASPASNLAPHHAAGRVRIIGLSAPQRYAGVLAQVPTWRELGVPVVIDNLRGIVGPLAMSVAQRDYWEAVFARLVRTPEWRTSLTEFHWSDSYAGADASRKALAGQYEEMRSGLAALGMVKPAATK